MSEDYELISNYVTKSKENFLIASSVAEKMTSISMNMRKVILEAVLTNLIEEIESKNYTIEHDLEGNPRSFIEFYKPSWVSLKVRIRMEADLKNLQGWIYGIKKDNAESPFVGNITKMLENENNHQYFRLQEQSKLSRSSPWWLCYDSYPQKYSELNNEILATSLSVEGMRQICSNLLQPLIDLTNNIEHIFDAAAQPS